MPRGDQTGPRGEGAMTGRGAGICSGNNAPENMNRPYYGRGFGRGGGRGFGMGGGRGWRNQYHATGMPGWARGYAYPYQAGFQNAPGTVANVKATPTDELAHLEEQVQYFKEALNNINSRIDELQQETGKTSKAEKKEKK